MASRWTLLEIVKEFGRRRGIRVPASVMSSTDETYLQIVGLLNEEVDELSNRFDWQALHQRVEFTHEGLSSYRAYRMEPDGSTSSSGTATFRGFVKNTLWDDTNGIPVAGPLNDEEWAAMLANNVSGALYSFKMGGGGIQIFPVPSPLSAVTFSFEGILAQAIHSYNSTGQNYDYYTDTFREDNDVCLLNGKLVLAGLRWRWNREKGLPYASEQMAYESRVHEEISREGGAPELHLDLSEDERMARPGLYIAAGGTIPP